MIWNYPINNRKTIKNMKDFKQFNEQAMVGEVNLSDLSKGVGKKGNDKTILGAFDNLMQQKGYKPFFKKNNFLKSAKNNNIGTAIYYTTDEVKEQLNDIAQEINSLNNKYQTIFQDKVKTRP